MIFFKKKFCCITEYEELPQSFMLTSINNVKNIIHVEEKFKKPYEKLWACNYKHVMGINSAFPGLMLEPTTWNVLYLKSDSNTTS